MSSHGTVIASCLICTMSYHGIKLWTIGRAVVRHKGLLVRFRSLRGVSGKSPRILLLIATLVGLPTGRLGRRDTLISCERLRNLICLLDPRRRFTRGDNTPSSTAISLYIKLIVPRIQFIVSIDYLLILKVQPARVRLIRLAKEGNWTCHIKILLVIWRVSQKYVILTILVFNQRHYISNVLIFLYIEIIVCILISFLTLIIALVNQFRFGRNIVHLARPYTTKSTLLE